PALPSAVKVPRGSTQGFAMSPDDRWVASYDEANQLIVSDLRTGKQILRLPAEGVRVWTWRFSPDGKRLAAGLSDGRLAIWDLAQVGVELAAFGMALPSSAGAPGPAIPV